MGKKYIVSQTGEGTNIISNGDHQNITITQVSCNGKKRQTPLGEVDGSDQEDNIATVGKNTKVFINGKRVQ